MSVTGLIASRYRLTDPIGAGAMGDVYRATDTQTGATVAIKHLKPDLVARAPDMLTRFQREGEALRELSHPNIVTMLDAIEANGNHYLVMEYVPGGDLRAVIADNPGGLPVGRALSIALDLADALTRAHRLEILHRDIKPANVLLAEDGTPRLTDFGIARIGSGSDITASGVVVGTYAYLSPEACMGQTLDQRADIWAFGVMLYEMLAGRRPFGGNSPGATMMATLQTPLPDISELRAGIPEALNDLLYRMLAKNRGERIPSVRLVGAEIEAIMKGIGSTSSYVIRQTMTVFATPALDVAQHRHNLPLQTTPFVGREQELSTIAAQFEQGCHLLTLLGPGGMGKSRLALEAAGLTLGQFVNGAFFVELAPLADPGNIPVAIAEATGYRFAEQASSEEQILNYLGNKEMLLILDNFEHLIEGRDIVTRILQAAPGVTILVTSRIRLNLSGETVFVLDPLAFPDWETPEDALQYSAVQLFMHGAKRARVDFELTADDLDCLARICRLVEGIPLGILLAAAWVDMLTLEEIAVEIQGNIDFLESEMGDLPERQRSMRAAFEYSWNLLSDGERDAFAKMSVFRGGCTRQAVQQVIGANLRMLTALVNKSLLRRDSESGRFHIHELLRQLAQERLETAGEADTIHDAHSVYYLKALAGREADLKGRNQQRALKDVESDFENIRAAWLWAADHQQADSVNQAVFSLYCFCVMRSLLGDVQPLIQFGREKLAPAVGEDPYPVLGRLIAWGSETSEELQEALAIARRCEDQTGEAFALYRLGLNTIEQQHDFKVAIDFFEQCLTLYNQLNDAFFIQLAEEWRSNGYFYLGESERATEVIRHSYEAAKANGNRIGEARALNDLGVYMSLSGKYAEAIQYLEAGIAIRRELDDKGGLQFMITVLSGFYYNCGEFEQAQKLLEEALDLSTEVNDPQARGIALLNQSFLVCILQEDYQRGQQLAREAYDIAKSYPSTHDYYTIAMGLAACGLNQYDAAREYLRAGLEQRMHPAMPASALPVSALMLAHDGQKTRAIELVSLVYHHYPQFNGYLQKEPQTNRLLAALKEELGEAAYQVAWEQGATLDLDTVIEELIAEFEGQNQE